MLIVKITVAFENNYVIIYTRGRKNEQLLR
ncbi:hypothetical protein HWD03_gp081 [Alteromonas phage vB_AmeM_PT11-V22]|uniref:Uncharacterized protein n=1 Tax=Alteromonas phage vB_AmeM_PT11-V22 TaxID=2704031 RepID=A0A6C0R2Z1_9CAUD|nr:hypothetical protein HWD03_gp081 [Alteromonas phage vB_AmeM_PT11-V22]QHZ59762.1 hypothetical protein [Alteromonas phage vB_AmeM_PT11-V22]